MQSFLQGGVPGKFIPTGAAKPAGFNCTICDSPVVVLFESVFVCACERAVALIEPTLELDAQSWAELMELGEKAGCTVALYGDGGPIQ